MLKRCIMIFPDLNNIELINEIRQKYDPLAKNVRPHITLVFPFDSDIGTNDLRSHISSALNNFKPFQLVLNKITPVESFGKYLFLNVQKGKNEIIQLHKKLYTGILEGYYPEWLADDFLPHMTVGSFDDDNKFKMAVDDIRGVNDDFEGIVDKISVEIIDENEDSIIEFDITLN